MNRDLREGFVLPRSIWELGQRQLQEGGDVLAVYWNERGYVLDEESWVIAEIKLGVADGVMKLQHLRLKLWEPWSPEQILAGGKVGLSSSETKALLRMTQINNKRLLEWKAKELADALPGYGKTQLQDMVIKLESVLLDLDSAINEGKECPGRGGALFAPTRPAPAGTTPCAGWAGGAGAPVRPTQGHRHGHPGDGQ